MDACNSVDLSSFKKCVTCGGRRYDEFSNFHACQIWAEEFESFWPSAEHYYQACKFPGASGADVREALRNTSSPMESWKLGNSHKALLRGDWEEVKLVMMYKANFLKFSQSEGLRRLLVDSEGPICCDGGLFWKTWNEVLLERVREELREGHDQTPADLELRIQLMQAYRSAVAAGDQRAADAVTQHAAKRQLPPEQSTGPVTVSGLVDGEAAMVFSADVLVPEINGQPHWISSEGWHLYLGVKSARCSWVLDEFCAQNEASGTAFMAVDGGDRSPPYGTQRWQVWDHSSSRHAPRELTVSA
eukprot:CAMPEP_0171189502 /NCGR_PEP_ID=MMETSP0790-20130122/18379_1 /TAXON_ID=2925 /ORGANISM="Alexandrium catenella, Strain OF101" /LENGTH=301 /DNA_ID=CAMNT_0011654615 /DNA_START=64 /DNA_END=969 /DNA_ORIENTATION=+